MFKRSLVLRLLLINVLVLILPMLLLLAYFFKENKTETVYSILYHMRDLGYSRATLVSQEIAFRKNALETLSKTLDFSNIDNLALQLKKIVHVAPGLQAISYAEKDEAGRFILAASSYYQEKGLDLTQYGFIQAALNRHEETVFVFGPHGMPWLFVTKLIEKPDHTIIGALTMAMSTAQLLSHLMNMNYSYLDIHFSLITPEGLVFASSDPLFSMVSIHPLSAEIIDQLYEEKEIKQKKIPYVPIKLLNIPPFQNVVEFDEEFLSLDRDTSARLGMLIPIEGSSTSFMLDISSKELLSDVHKSFNQSLILLITAALVVALLIWILLKRLSRPLLQLKWLMKKIGSGDYDTRYATDEVGYEINIAGAAINTMLDNLLRQREIVKNERVKQEMFAKELKIGHEILLRILPQQLPVLEKVSLAAQALPALEVGGDFYDLFIQKGEGGKKRLLITIADTAGKGISACLYSLCLRSMLRSYVVSSKDIAATIKNANKLFCLDTEESAMFVTVFAGLLDPETMQLDYYSAGHLPALIKHRDGTIDKLWTPGVPFGISPFAEVRQKSVILQEGDLLFLYTDGVTEAMNKEGALFGDDRLMTFFKENKASSPEAFIDSLIETVKTFENGAEQHDDITAVAVKIGTSPLVSQDKTGSSLA